MTTVRTIITHLGDQISAAHGPTDRLVRGVASLRNASEGCLTFCRYDDHRASEAVSAVGACTIICAEQSEIDLSQLGATTVLLSPNPRLAFLRTVQRFFAPETPPPGSHVAAFVSPGATVHPTASIGAHCFVGDDVTIGARTVLYPGVAVYCPAVIGADVRIHAGTVIGADGFGYERNDDGRLESFPHIGGVTIENDVHVGANTCIDRGSLDDTLLCEGARIDNLVHISHNVRVGKRAAVIANAMVAGSVDIGDEAWIAPSASILNQKRIGARGVVGFGAVVVKDVPDDEVVMGSPAVPQAQFKINQQALKRLTDG